MDIEFSKYFSVTALLMFILFIIFGVVMLIVLAKMSKTPDNATGKHIHNINRKLVVCFGDSITQGTVSFDYLKSLSEDATMIDYDFVNAGVNGDLAYNALKRIDSVIRLDPDYIIILLGTNDVNATLSKQNEKMYMKDKHLPQKPEKVWYEENLTDLVKTLKQKTTAKIAILSIPVIGEKLDSLQLQQTKEYSAIIKKIAQAESISYLPLNEKQVEFLEEKKHEPKTLYSNNTVGLIFKTTFVHYILNRDWNEISLERGLLLTTDTLHQNSVAGSMIIMLIKDFLLKKY